jgi:tetratricopeptide (TPR) repeat protein
VDTRADVYALGVLLYELLTGTTPVEREQLTKTPYDEILRVIRENEAPTPSKRLSSTDAKPTVAANRRTEPVKLCRLLRGDLDWIVMKALAKERDRRYDTATSFARDIERFLNHEPVLAGPPNTVYRLRKFVRRHRTQVIAGCLLLLALLTGIAGTTFGLIQAEQARADEAEQRGVAEGNAAKALSAAQAERAAKERESIQRHKAEKARDRTWDALDAMTSSVTGDSLTTQTALSDEQKKFLNGVLTFYRELAAEQTYDELSRWRTAEAAYRVGLIEHRLGRKAESEAANRLARDVYAKVAADFPAVPLYRQRLATCHNNLGILLVDLGKRQEGEEQYRQALALRENLAADFPAQPAYRQDLAASLNNLGLLLSDLGKQATAEVPFRQALAIRQKLAADAPGVGAHRFELAASHNNLALLLNDLGKRTEAVEQHRQALAIQEKLAADFPAVPDCRRDLAASHNNLGLLLIDLGRQPEAEPHHRQALTIFEKLVAGFPTVPEYLQGLASSHTNLGQLLFKRGKAPEAEQQYRLALATQEKLAADFPAVPAYRLDLGASHNNLGVLLIAVGVLPQAKEHLRQAVSILQKLAADSPAVPAYRKELASSHNNLGVLLLGSRKLPEAEEHLRQVLTIREQLAAEFPAVPAYQVQLANSYNNFGLLVSARGQPGESLGWHEKAIRTLTAVYVHHPQLADAKRLLGPSHWYRAMAYDRLQKYAEAVKDWDRAIEHGPKQEQPRLRAARATAQIKAGQAAEAVAEVEELLKLPGVPGPILYDFACVYSLASAAIAGKKQVYADRAVQLLQQAVRAGHKIAAHMKRDPDLDPIRARADFRQLMAELEK